MKVYEIAIRRPVTTLMFISSLLLLGYISWLHLPVQLFPDLTFPALGIFAGYSPGTGGATPDEIEEKITIPIENIVASLPRVKKIESHTGEGYCWLWVEMEYGADMRFLAIEVQERLEPLKKNFPRGTVRFGVEQIDTAEFQKVFMHLVMKGPGEGEQVRAVVVDRIQQRLEDLPGVSGVRVGGYSPERVRVRFDEQRLKEHRLPFQSVVQRVEGWSSPDVYLGEYKTRDRVYYVRIAGRYENLLDIQEVPLQEGKGLYLRDVAEVTQKSSREEREWLYRYEGREAIGIQLEKEALANPLVVSASGASGTGENPERPPGRV
jgi:HAE1 family hydrophobic/amphiphilic exporter-1